MAKYPKTLGRIEAVWNKLGGEEGVDRFLGDELVVVERQNNVPIAAPTTGILRSISAGQTIMLEPTDGQRTMAQAEDVFSGYLDSDFRNYGCDVPGVAKPATPAEVLEMVKDGNFEQIFGSFGIDLDQLRWEQDQIIQFCQKHQSWLRTEGYGTFFLFKANGEFFVASVDWRERRLGAYVDRLSDGYVWRGARRHRVVVPQLTPTTPGA